MRAGRTAGRSDITDDLPLVDLGAAADAGCQLAHVRVERFIGLVVLDLDGDAIGTVAAGDLNGA